MKKFCVYIHKNKINGKVYVGQTSKDVWSRWGLNGQQYCYGQDTKFSKAIKKYGFDNFEHIIIQDELTKEEANKLEKELIALYDSYKNGYNSTLGDDGGGFINHIHSEESKKLMVHYGEDNGMYGKTRPDYVKEAVRKAHAKSVCQYDLQGNFIAQYESATEVKRLYGYDNSLINKCCKMKHRTAYGYYWRYANDSIDDILKILN